MWLRSPLFSTIGIAVAAALTTGVAAEGTTRRLPKEVEEQLRNLGYLR